MNSIGGSAYPNEDRPLPVIMHHGMGGLGKVSIGGLTLNYFHGIDRAIARAGHDVHVSRVHPTASIVHRAAQLKEFILERVPTGKVILIGHSMGGLDARYMISRLGMEHRVDSLLSVCTPHRGSSFADWAIRKLRSFRAFAVFKMLGWDVSGAMDLTLDSCARFNESIVDSPLVKYYSISASAPLDRIPCIAAHSHRIVSAAEGENDALVSVSSARWGAHLATWAVDHFLTINRRLIWRNPIADISPFYLQALAVLAPKPLLIPLGA